MHRKSASTGQGCGVMRIAIVHDYIKEYGGAERVLEVLSEVFPEAPIYTAFYKKDSLAYQRFKDKKIIPSWVHYIPFFATKLHSPLRFLAPWIWGSFSFSDYDVVISSASWYVTKGFGRRDSSQSGMTEIASPAELDRNDEKKKGPVEICYCHTPPRWLYGYKTSIEWQKFWPIKVYGTIIGHFMRMYDFNAAQKVDYFIANSEEVASRIKKFYRREATVIYPPVELPKIQKKWEVRSGNMENEVGSGRGDYYFIVSRIVGGKGLDLAVEAATKMGFKLKIAGAPAGYYTEYKRLIEKGRGSRNKFGMTSNNNVEFLGHVTDDELVKLYSGAKAFLALAKDEDFGITPVESMSCGTPVIAYNGGGYKETVVNGETGVFFNEQSVESLISAIKKFEKLSIKPEDCIRQAQKFSKERFKKEIESFVKHVFLSS